MNSIYIYLVIFLSAFLVTFVLEKIILRVALRRKIGQKILENGPVWHKEKEGTPTMGGIAFSVALLVAFLIFTVFFSGASNSQLLMIFGIVLYAIINSLIGFFDDCLKLKKNQNKGLSAPSKFALQSIAAVIFIVFLQKTGEISTALKIPFTNISFDIGIFYYFLAYLLLCGFVNAVNLTDGLDGLATASMLPVSILFSIVGLLVLENFAYTFIGSALLGMLIAFLIFNSHPAKIFMGDTGSLFLGGILAGLSLCIDNALLIVLFGFVYLCEALSVILQVVYFKISHGKRILKMAPLHHHLEKCGWSEKRIVTVFTIINSVTCIVALLGMII